MYSGVNVSGDDTDYEDPGFFAGSVDDGNGVSVVAGFPFAPWGAAEVGWSSSAMPTSRGCGKA